MIPLAAILAKEREAVDSPAVPSLIPQPITVLRRSTPTYAHGRQIGCATLRQRSRDAFYTQLILS